jgi:hypothetical protein
VVTEVVIVASPNDGTGAKAAEAATIVDDGGARAKAMEAAIKSATVEASTGKTAAAVEATAAETTAAMTTTAAETTAAMTTTATTTTTSSSATTSCQRHGRRGQANGCNS